MVDPSEGAGREGTRKELAAGEVLFSAGDDSDSVYFVRAGRLEVVHISELGEVVVGSLGPGDVVGEITAVVGGRRTAMVRAALEGSVSLDCLTAETYGRLLEDQPDEARRIAAVARRRIDSTRVARVLTELVGPGHEVIIDDVNAMIEWVDLEAGTELFAQGDTADAAYIVVAGRLRLTTVDGGETSLDVSVGRGDIVGELGVVERAPRSAKAVATRDSTLAKLSAEAFAVLTAKHPALMLQIFRTIVTRVMRPQHRPPAAGLIAVAVLDPSADPQLVRDLADEIGRHGQTLYLDREQVGQFFHRRGIVDAEVGSAEHARFDEFLNEADVAHRWVVLETDPTLTTWSRRALRSADRVLLVASANPSAGELAALGAFTEIVDCVADRELWLVQSNPSTGLRLNAKAMNVVKPDRLLQLHRGDASSTARVARLASGTATGVALSGGGGRGLAHIGALRALVESGYEIDVISGTSMGSIVGATMAMLADADAVLASLVPHFRDNRVIDYTLPMVSFVSGKGLANALHSQFGDRDLRDLTLPFSCLSTNLTTAQLRTHRDGLVTTALRASVSLPGVFPPVVENGDLLVDGGVLQNLPVDPLFNDPAVDRIIGVDVSPPMGPSAKYDYGMALGGPTALVRQIGRGRKKHPKLGNTVMSSMLLGSSQARHTALEQGLVDLYLTLDLRGVGLLEFGDLALVADRGYEATIDALERHGAQET